MTVRHSINSSTAAYNLLRTLINPWQEELWVIALNSELQLLEHVMLFRGTAEYCLVHPRDLFRTLILTNASAFMMAHNHPSGNILPSHADLKITQRFQKLGQLMEIKLVDHLIVGSESFFSFADRGLLKTRKARL